VILWSIALPLAQKGSPVSEISLLVEGIAQTVAVQVTICSPAQARRKGVAIGFLVALGAAVSIFIPIVHFLSVPLGLIAAPVAGYAAYRIHLNSVDIITGGLTCPHCGEWVSLAGCTVHADASVLCGSCQRQISFKKSS